MGRRASEGFDNHALREEKGRLVDGEKLHWGFFLFIYLFCHSAPINGTDVHLWNKLQTHLASGAAESPQCVGISHSGDH